MTVTADNNSLNIGQVVCKCFHIAMALKITGPFNIQFLARHIGHVAWSLRR